MIIAVDSNSKTSGHTSIAPTPYKSYFSQMMNMDSITLCNLGLHYCCQKTSEGKESLGVPSLRCQSLCVSCPGSTICELRLTWEKSPIRCSDGVPCLSLWKKCTLPPSWLVFLRNLDFPMRTASVF